VKNFCIERCKNLKDLSNFPDHVNNLELTYSCGNLLFFHEKYHEKKSIDDIAIYDSLGDPVTSLSKTAPGLFDNFIKLSDPFEFQDWCINNRLRGVLMKLQQLFEAENELGFDEKYTREDNPEVYTSGELTIYRPFKNENFADLPRIFKKPIKLNIRQSKLTDFVGLTDQISEKDNTFMKIDVTPADFVVSETNPLTSLKGLPKQLMTLNVSGAIGLTSLEYCPSITALRINKTGIRSFEHLQHSEAPGYIMLSIQATWCEHLTSFDGLPKEMNTLVVAGSDNLDFESFPKSRNVYSITLSLNKQLMVLHELRHEYQCFFNIFLCHPGKSLVDFEISKQICSISDPFEFQDWCINNRLRGVLMKLQHLFEEVNSLGIDEKYTREDNPEAYDFPVLRLVNRKLTSLDGLPKVIGNKCGIIDVGENHLTSLIGFPQFESDEVAKNCSISVHKNRLTSFEGLPKYTIYLNAKANKKLTSLEGCPVIGSFIQISECKMLGSLKRIEIFFSQPNKHIRG
jgi:hypothetical protein